MNPYVSKTLFDPAVEQTFMESYYIRAAEQQQMWLDQAKEMLRAAEKQQWECTAVFRELYRRMKRSLRIAEEGMRILARAEPKTWGRGQDTLEIAWESLENVWALWSRYTRP